LSQLEENNLGFFVNEEMDFCFPLQEVSRATLSNKANNEIAIEFHQNDEEGMVVQESLVEMRFYIPPKQGKSGDSSRKKAEKLLKKIYSKTEIDVTDNKNVVLKFNDLSYLTPRGRYTIQIFSDKYQMIGSDNHTIKYDNIQKLTLLPKPDNQSYLFVISLKNPIRSGYTVKSHLVATILESQIIKKLDVNTVDLSTEIADKLRTLEGPSHEVISQVFNIFIQKKNI